MNITNKLTGEVYDYKVGSLDERKFIRVMDGFNCGNNEKLFFETEIESVRKSLPNKGILPRTGTFCFPLWISSFINRKYLKIPEI